MGVIWAFIANGERVLFWVLTLVGAQISRLVLGFIREGRARQIIDRALIEVGDAVLMVGKTYVDAIKKATEDGRLTPEEGAEAKARALATAKSNIGPNGLKRLERVLDANVDGWLDTKIESAVSVKASTMPPPMGTAGVAAAVAAIPVGPASLQPLPLVTDQPRLRTPSMRPKSPTLR